LGSYLAVRAKPDCEQQINEAYAKHMNDPNAWLVYTDAIIRSEIAYIRSPAGDDQAHLRRALSVVENWDYHFPLYKSGMGRLKLGGTNEDFFARVERIRRTLAFVLEHRMLFQSITGIDDARAYVRE